MKTLIENELVKITVLEDGTIKIVNKLSDLEDNFLEVNLGFEGSISIKAPNSHFVPTREGFDVWLRS